jgi:hypothetical protein
VDNIIADYFEGFESLSATQQNYVVESLNVWKASGLLQVVMEGKVKMFFGKLKEGSSACVNVDTGNAVLSADEFEREVKFFQRFGVLMAVPTRVPGFIEVRLNAVVSHSFAHQLQFVLSKRTQERILELYRIRLDNCNRLHPAPEGSTLTSEVFAQAQFADSVFVAGYARTSPHEYFAEAVSAFSFKDGRDRLKEVDRDIYQLLVDLIYQPEGMLIPDREKSLLEIRAQIKAGGGLPRDFLNKF